jgi:Tfp pilus assembly protein PilX
MILANLTALIAVTAIRAMTSQNRRSKIQRKNDYLQKTGAAYAAALIYGSLLE